jgi:dTMP kinase
MKKRGKLVVIEGIDGSGKDTQAKLLVGKLRKSGYKAKKFDFPQYRKTFFGDVVGRFLGGEFGSLKEVNPYLASMIFAGDRWQAKEKICKYLNNCYIVVSNRYVLSHSHQASKLPVKRRRDFWDFIEKLEYKVYGVPKEDVNILLDVPVEIGQKLILKKTARKYLRANRKRDIQERNISYQEETRKVYLGLVSDNKNIIKIPCLKDGKLMSIEEIHATIWEKVKPLI